jgi:hypothetical protein
MYLKARLGWLSGFPLRQSSGQVEWLAVPRYGRRLPDEMLLTRRQLHMASRTWQKLNTRLPRVLPQIVEDLAHWRSGVPRLLSLLSDAIHQDTALPRSLFMVSDFHQPEICQDAKALAEAQPGLRPWLDALSWFTYLYPPEAAAALAWSRQQAEELNTMLTHNDGLKGVVLTQLLWSLTSRDGADLLASVRRLLGNPQLYTTPDTDVSEVLPFSLRWTQLLKGAASGKEERNYRRQVRRNALALFNLVWSDELLAAWASWWEETEQLVRRAKQLIRLQNQAAIHTESKSLRRRLHAGREQMPPPLYLEPIVTQIHRASLEYEFSQELIPILELVKNAGMEASMRASLLQYWVQLLGQHRPQMPILLRCLRTGWQRVGNRPGMFAPWEFLHERWRLGKPHFPNFEETILDEVPEQRFWPVICDSLAACAGVVLQLDTDTSQGGDSDAADVISARTIVKLAILTESATHAKVLVDSLAAQPLKTSFLEPDVLSCAYHLDGGRGYFGRLVAMLQTVSSGEGWVIPALRVAADRLEIGGWQELATELILHGHMKRLAQIGLCLQALAQFDLVVSPPSPLPPGEKTPAWIKSYPRRLNPVLRLLASLHPAAQKRAARALKKDFPDDSRLQQEIMVLRQKLSDDPEQPKLARRLAHLEQRLASPRPVSDQRLARLEEKLVRLVALHALAVWERDIDATLRPALAAEVMVADLPDWMLVPRQIQVVVELLTLPAAFRQLGLRLLRTRCGPPPWSLIDDPVNQQFINTMEQRGVRMEPWLNPPAPRRFTGTNGRVVHLHFETDPLEIFQMGNYFNTCLSPGEFNFFSVFANAADVNKKVVYARNEQEQVVGRCLLTLTEEGSLLTFEPYCHDPALGFTEMIARVVTDLGAQMGAPIHLRGRVPALVAPSWYDDGPQDVTGRFEFLNPGSDFRNELPSMSPEAFLNELETLFTPLPFNSLSLPLIVELPELKEHPTLILPLIPYLEAEKALPDHTVLQAVKLANLAGEEYFVHKVVRTWAPAYLQRSHRHRYLYPDTDLVMMLAEYDPSAALRFLRSSRPPGVRRDEEEEGWRREALAVAHENLARYALAQKLRAA